MKFSHFLPLAGVLLLSTLAPRAEAQVAIKKIDYQGKLLDSNSLPLSAGAANNYIVIFRIYNQQSGTAGLLWTEQQTVTVSDGLFSVRLGEGGVFTPGNGTPESHPDLTTVFDGKERYLGMTVVISPATVATAGELTPRLAFLATPQAFVANRALVADNVADGSLITNINANNIASGRIQEVQLPTTLVYKDRAQTIDGAFTFNSATNSFRGVGTNLTGLSAANLTGALSTDVLPANVPLIDKVNVFTRSNTFAGAANGSTPSVLISGSNGNQLRFQAPENGNLTWDMYGSQSNGEARLYFKPFNPALTYNSAYMVPGGGIFNASDVRLKDEIVPMTSVLDRVLKLRPVTYRYRTQEENAARTIGLIAQEVEPFFPEMVGETGGYKSLAYGELGPVAIGAIQEQHQQIQDLDARKQKQIDSLREENAGLQRQMQRLLERLDTLEGKAAQ